MSSRTLVAVHRSMERDHDVLPPVRRPYAVSELRWSATCGGTRLTIRKCQHSDILQPPSLETPIVGADGGRSCIFGARPDDQLHGGLRPLSSFWPSAVWRSVAERHPSDPLQPSPYFIIGPRTWADEWGTPDLLGSPCHRPAQHVLVFPSMDNWTTNHLIP